MRILIFLFSFLFVSNITAQNGFKFETTDYKTTLQQSKREKKPIFLMLYASWCSHCNKMKNEVFTDPKVTDLLSKNYICVWQDIESVEGIMLKNKFKTTSLPTFIFLDSDEKEMYRLKGEWKSSDFMDEIKYSLNPKFQLPYLEKEYLSDPSNAQKWVNYMEILKKGFDRSTLSQKAQNYFATQSDKQLISATNWVIISNAVTDISSREFQTVLQHKKEFEAVSSPIRVERKTTNIVTELLMPFTENLDTVNYNKQRKIAKTIDSEKIDALIFGYDLTIAERTENWSNYKKTTLESTKKQAWNNPSLLKEIGQNYLKHITDTPSLKQAIEWTNRSLELNNTMDGNLLISKLYLKVNNKKSADLYARKAKDICNSLNCNSKDIDALFLELHIK